MKEKTGFVMKAKEETHKEDPVDQAAIDLHFIGAFIDLLWQVDRIDELQKNTVSAMCSESKKRINNLQRFIAAIPIKTVKAA